MNRLQKLAGIKEWKIIPSTLLSFVERFQQEIAEKIGASHLRDIRIDDLGDVGAIGVYENMDEDENIEGGLAFRYPKDVDENFVGQEGDKPKSIIVRGRELMYIGYNI